LTIAPGATGPEIAYLKSLMAIVSSAFCAAPSDVDALGAALEGVEVWGVELAGEDDVMDVGGDVGGDVVGPDPAVFADDPHPDRPTTSPVTAKVSTRALRFSLIFMRDPPF
jgi:hypothetical protein